MSSFAAFEFARASAFGIFLSTSIVGIGERSVSVSARRGGLSKSRRPRNRARPCGFLWS
jgi:hypothetical protein